MNPAQTVSDVDESIIVDLLLGHYPATSPDGLILGAGDDCAVLAPSPNRTLVTVDTLVEGQDFLPVWPSGYVTTGEDVGFKSAAQNLSDINAMGGVATVGFVTLSLPPTTPLNWVEGYARGVAEAALALGAPTFTIAGGDLSSSTELQIGMTVLGAAVQPVARSGARPGDRLLIAGETPGRADAALGLLLSTARPDAVGRWSARDAAVAAAQFRSCPPLGLGAKRAEGLTALMDVSDGLVKDSQRLAVASGVSLDFDGAALQREANQLRDWGGRHTTEALHRVLYGGEDFLLLGTSPGAEPVPDGFRQIGTVHVEGQTPAVSRLTLDGVQISLGGGFDHFAVRKP